LIAPSKRSATRSSSQSPERLTNGCVFTQRCPSLVGRELSHAARLRPKEAKLGADDEGSAQWSQASIVMVRSCSTHRNEYDLLRMASSATKSRVRVQLDLAADEARGLDELRERYSLRSRADAVRLALGILEWLAEQSESGRRIIAVGRRDVVHLAVPGVTNRRLGGRASEEVPTDG